MPFYSAKGASETYETCFVPLGTKLAARFARCLFVKMSRFNEKQYYSSGPSTRTQLVLSGM